MDYGVKAIRTIVIGDNEQRFYEELILRIDAISFDDAYEKASQYLKNADLHYVNIEGKKVETIYIETIDCFLAYEQQDGVQEVYSAFYANKSTLSEDAYYRALTSPCDEAEMYPLRNQEFC